jgi:hypothetical protein
MPYRKNSQREETLLKHWRSGDTVKVASTLTSIPEGTVSHYYARFNRRKDMYRKVSENGYQEPQRPSPFEAASAGVFLTNVNLKVNQLFESGDYAKARDYLQAILLHHDLIKRLLPIVQGADPKKKEETLWNVIMLVKLTETSSKAAPAEKTTASASTS